MNDEQTQGDSSPQSMEDRIEAQLFGEDDPVEEVDGEQVEQDEGEQPEAAPALETVEFEGKEYQLPPELKAAVLRQSDYTVKTQEVAELRRSAQAAEHAIKVEREFHQSVTEEQSALGEINAQLKQYKSLDWTDLDATALFRLQQAVDGLKERKGEIEASITAKKQQFHQALDGAFRQRVAATEQYMAKSVKGWDAKAGTELTQYLASNGLGDHAIRSVVADPVQTMVWYKAQQYDKAKAGAVVSKSTAPIVKPGATAPEVSKRMQTLNFKKQLSQAKDSRSKAAIIQKRVEAMF